MDMWYCLYCLGIQTISCQLSGNIYCLMVLPLFLERMPHSQACLYWKANRSITKLLTWDSSLPWRPATRVKITIGEHSLRGTDINFNYEKISSVCVQVNGAISCLSSPQWIQFLASSLCDDSELLGQFRSISFSYRRALATFNSYRITPQWHNIRACKGTNRI
jgi:hypothetical protein